MFCSPFRRRRQLSKAEKKVKAAEKERLKGLAGEEGLVEEKKEKKEKKSKSKDEEKEKEKKSKKKDKEEEEEAESRGKVEGSEASISVSNAMEEYVCAHYETSSESFF